MANGGTQRNQNLCVRFQMRRKIRLTLPTNTPHFVFQSLNEPLSLHGWLRKPATESNQRPNVGGKSMAVSNACLEPRRSLISMNCLLTLRIMRTGRHRNYHQT